jgi:hypothetical protein
MMQKLRMNNKIKDKNDELITALRYMINKEWI